MVEYRVMILMVNVFFLFSVHPSFSAELPKGVGEVRIGDTLEDVQRSFDKDDIRIKRYDDIADSCGVFDIQTIYYDGYAAFFVKHHIITGYCYVEAIPKGTNLFVVQRRIVRDYGSPAEENWWNAEGEQTSKKEEVSRLALRYEGDIQGQVTIYGYAQDIHWTAKWSCKRCVYDADLLKKQEQLVNECITQKEDAQNTSDDLQE